jgi:hypothetical protein
MAFRMMALRWVCFVLWLNVVFVAASTPMRTPMAAQADKAAERFPWSPEVRCTLNPSRPQGLHPDARSALESLSLVHRVTQGINQSSDRGNVHNTDVTINGTAYTGAVDISVRCLSEAQIRTLLGRLASLGFAGWYRKDGEDGWKGPPHIHAVLAGSRMKPVLQWQVESWLEGRNGLSANPHYRFWQASEVMKERVRGLYRKLN